ncbi:MAG TPA: NAD(P)H-hydrate dehydratase [Acidimicrobiia bacterium]|nr:NAD(P)H-hydrate dehydratase [Acidimicrobiia bacterium]
MEFVLTPEQMALADRAAVESGTPVAELMDRAGWALARGVRDVLGGTYGRRVVVACGKGNNGGDGRVAAAVLDRWGVRAEVISLEAGVARDALTRAVSRADVCVDAMYGTGFRGVLDGDADFVAATFASSGVPVVSCDIPSGVDGLTGRVEGRAVDAVLTVCFAALKTGLLFAPGRGHAGVIKVVPIGVDVTRVPGHPACLLDDDDVALLLPDRDAETHKWAAGAVYVVAGSGGMLGAATLAARAALRSGAGLVALGVPGTELAARASGGEVITKALAETPEGLLDETAAKEVLGDLDRFGSLVIGPGLGRDIRTANAVRAIVADAPIPVVVDADGLFALAEDPGALERRRGDTVLTPHLGEFERLTGASGVPDRVAAATAAAADFGAVVLLKGSTTVIAEPGGRVVLNRTGGSWLATAGTGDVLAGIIGSLLAQGVPAFEAAAAGAWLHGSAADHVRHHGLIAGDLIDALPAAMEHVRRETTRPSR